MRGILRLSAALGGLWLAALSPSYAQPQPQCELHIWPGSDLGSVYHGWFHGGIVNGAVEGRDGYRAINTDPLATENQRRLLPKLPLTTWLGLPDHRPVYHDQALDSRTIRSTAGRIQSDGAPCYAELIIDDLMFQEDIVTGRHLKTLIRFRDFGSDQMVKRSFGTWTMTKLNLFPPQTAEAEGPAVTEMQSAFEQNIEKFGEYLRRPVKARK